MRLLHTSDWHIGRFLNEYSLLEDQKYILDEILSIATQNKVDVIVISGDLFDRSVPSAAAVSMLDDFFYSILQKGIKIVAVCGNHDGRKRMGFLSRMCTLSGIYLANEFDPKSAKITLDDEFGNVNFYLIPYTEPSDLPDIDAVTFNDTFASQLDMICGDFNSNERNIAVAHGFFAGVGHENETLFSESEISIGPADMISADYLKKFDYAALGHLHRSQYTGEKYIRYSGSPLKYSVDDISQTKSVTLVDLKEKGSISYKEIPLSPLREIVKIRGSFEDILRPSPNAKYLNDYVYAEITDDFLIPNAMAQLKNVYPNILAMRIVSRDKEREAVLNINSDIDKKDPVTLFCEFYSSLKDSEPSESQLSVINSVFDSVTKGRCEE